MLFKLCLITTLLAVHSRAEAPLNNRAPYPAAGYRPSIPFDLPGEYYPPFEAEAGEQFANQGISFEVSKQRIDFAGQELQNVPLSDPQNQYLPPEQIVFINNRVGNGNRGTRYFGHRHAHGRHNDNGFHQTPSKTPQNTPTQNRPPQFQPDLPSSNIPLPKPTTDERFESQKFLPKDRQRPALQYGAPNYNIDPRYAGKYSQQASPQTASSSYNINNNLNLAQPALQYDTPNYNFEDSQQQQSPALEYGAPINSQNNREKELEKQYALDALKAAVENYNRLQEDSSDKIAQGQYFIVNPDHSIQKVKFTTKKSDDENKQNDFTAELKYTKVGEINDPLYKYTAEGQLVRIVKK